MWVVPQAVPAALVRRTLGREQLPNGGGPGCPVSEETKETTGVGGNPPGSCLWLSHEQTGMGLKDVPLETKPNTPVT